MVRRAVLIRDERPDIGQEIHEALRRGPSLIFTSGGLGPTADDMTLDALAAALDRPLSPHPQALQLVADRYQDLADRGIVERAELTPERRKMAILPQGAQPLLNPVGGAPGVLLEQDGSTIVALPGVPAELKAIFETSLSTYLQAWLGEASYQEWTVVVACGDESILAPAVDAVAASHPQVYVKSRAKPYGPDVRLTVTLSARGASLSEVNALLTAAQEDLLGRLPAVQIDVLDILKA
jgi:molybdopterin-biosynthesis enzyme MoeA-like protein